MTARDQILGDIRTALGRAGHARPAPLSAPLLRNPQTARNLFVPLFVRNLEKLAGKVFVVPSPAAVAPVLRELLQAKQAVASNAPFLKDCGIGDFEQIRSGFTDRDELRRACASADVGISSVDYALAETGSFVMFSSHDEARLISLLPPAHVAIIPRSKILVNLDELLATVPKPAERSGSMVLITGGSRTADIEQILIRGVHGPGDVYAVVVEDV
jgi:L-lactate dehydrogenase complex protein LldG